MTYARALLCRPPFFNKVFCEFKGFDSCSFQYLIINLEHFSSHQINILPVHSYLRQSCRWNLFLTIYCDDFWQSTTNIIRVIMAEISSNYAQFLPNIPQKSTCYYHLKSPENPPVYTTCYHIWWNLVDCKTRKYLNNKNKYL